MGQVKLPEKDKNGTKGVRIVMMVTHHQHFSRILLERSLLRSRLQLRRRQTGAGCLPPSSSFYRTALGPRLGVIDPWMTLKSTFISAGETHETWTWNKASASSSLGRLIKQDILINTRKRHNSCKIFFFFPLARAFNSTLILQTCWWNN